MNLEGSKLPTGYTADVQSGRITEFEDFVWSCARAFGALVTMRDDPADATIPENFAPSPFHTERLAEARDRLSRLKAMSEAEVAAEAAAALTEAEDTAERVSANRAEQRRRYEAMLNRALLWSPPTPDHLELRDFMIRQLRESIEFDCSKSSLEEVDPSNFTPAQWLADQMAKAHWEIAYHTKEAADEQRRTDERNNWIAELRRSLAPSPLSSRGEG